MRLYQNKILILVFILVVSVLTLVLFFDEYDINNEVIHSNAIVNTHVELLPAIPKNCSFQLYAGWNMVSFYCLGSLNDRSIALQSIDGLYHSIFTYNAADLGDPWKSYNPSLPNWTVQQLNYMDRVSGYWIYIDTNSLFFYSGKYYDSSIPLSNGWNFVGYSNINSTSINSSLIGVSFSAVKYYDTQSNTWLTYYVGSSSNSLTQFETYKGYWINVSGTPRWNITRN